MNLKFISDAPQTSKGSIPWFVSFRIDISYGLDHFVVCRALRFIKRMSVMMLGSKCFAYKFFIYDYNIFV